MSVDPDDKTPLAIKNTGADIISYGSPVLPGAMFFLSYYKKDDRIIPISLDFRGVPCIIKGLFLTWFCQDFLQMI